MKKILLLFTMTLLSIIVLANPVEIDGIYYDLKSASNEAYVTENPNKYSGNIVIPENVTYDGTLFKVTTIDNEAFKNCHDLRTISIAHSVVNINDSAFQYCSSLKEVTLGWGINMIGEKTFAACDSLTAIYCYTETVPGISSDAFDESPIENATLYVREKAIEEYEKTSPWNKFKRTDKLEIPKHTLTYYVDGETYKTYELEEGTTIVPEDDPCKDGYTFSGWSEIPKRMLYEDIKISGKFTINTYILSYYVDGELYKSYEIVYGKSIIPESALNKEGYTFSGWSEIPRTMPAHNVDILGEFTINKYKLTYIVNNDEYKSDSLEYNAKIVLADYNEPLEPGYVFQWGDHPTYMPAHDVVIYGEVVALVANSYILVDGIRYKCLDNSEGLSVSRLKEPYAPEGYNTPASELYCGDIVIPAEVDLGWAKFDVVKIEEGAFWGCEELSSIVIPEGIKSIGGGAFSGSGIRSIVIPNSVESISNSLSHIYHLKEVFIGSKVKDINRWSFEQTELENIRVSEDNPYFDSRDNCNAIVETATNTIIKGAGVPNFPKTVTRIGSEAFMGNQDIIDLVIPEWIDSIGWGAFSMCQQMKSAIIKCSLNYVPNDLFSENVRLKTVKFLGNINAFNSFVYVDNMYIMSEEVPYLKESIFGNNVNYEYIREENKRDNLYVKAHLVDSYKADEKWNISFKNILPAYMATYMLEGELFDEDCHEEGAELSHPLPPEKEGYTFSGWIDAPTTMPANDITVTGTFTINKYKLTYMVDGAEYKSSDVEYGAAITPEPAPTKEGCTFSGWSEIPSTMPANDVVVTGSFSAIEIKEDTGEFTATSGSTVELSNDNNVSGEYEIPETVTYDDVIYTVTSIGNEAFKDNTSLTDVTIPSTIISIGEGAFAGCSNLKSITVNSTTPIAFSAASRTRGGSSVFEGVDKNTCVLYVPEGTVDAYRAAAVWGEFTNILVIGSSGINGIILDGKTFDVYDLKGRMIKTNTTSLDGLPKGVYIIGGKKVLK